jgi:threonine efflux protein
LQIDYGTLGAFALLWLAILPTPGPNSLLIVHLALTHHWRSVSAALAGNLIGIGIYAICSLLGLGLLLAAVPPLRFIVYVLGGVYLAWIGIRLVLTGLARRRLGAPEDQASKALEARAARKPFLLGFFTALSNAPALFFLASIFASTGIMAAALATQLAAIAVVVVGNGTYLALLAWLLQRERPRAFYARNRGAAEIGCGVIYLSFGVRIVLQQIGGG